MASNKLEHEFSSVNWITSYFRHEEADPNVLVEILAQNGYTISVIDKKGKTLLHYALEQGNTKLIEHIKQMNLEIYEELLNVRDDKDLTAVETAISYNKIDYIDPLLAGTNFDINTPNEHGQTVLHNISKGGAYISGHLVATSIDKKIKLLTKLHEYKGKMNVQDKHGYTPLHYFAETGDVDLLKAVVAIWPQEELEEAAAITNHKNYLPSQIAIANGITANYIPECLAANLNNDISIEAWESLHSLRTVFNNKKVTQLLSTIDDNLQYDGGLINESLNLIIADYHDYLINLKIPMGHDLQRLEMAFEQLRTTTNPTQDMKLYNTGMVGHTVLALCAKVDDRTDELLIFDRGAFVNPISAFNGLRKKGFANVAVGHRILITKDCVPSLNLAKSKESEKEAKEILFQDIPQANNQPVTDVFYQKPFKGGMCFYENFKAVLRYMFEKSGDENGDILYKGFDIKLHLEKLITLLKVFNAQEITFKEKYQANYYAIYLECAKIIQKKYSQFQKLASGSKNNTITLAVNHIETKMTELKNCVKTAKFNDDKKATITLIDYLVNPILRNSQVDQYKKALNRFFSDQFKNGKLPITCDKYMKLLAIKNKINATHYNTVEDIQPIIADIRKHLSKHREMGVSVKTFFNLFRSTDSLSRFNKYFDENNHLRTGPSLHYASLMSARI